MSVEASGEETTGKTPVIQKSEHWQANNTIGGEKARGPFFNGPNQFAVHFTFDVMPNATGQRITREQFFYDGEH